MDKKNNILLEEKTTQTVVEKKQESIENTARSFFSSKKTLNFFSALLSLVVIYGIYYWGTPAIIDLPNKRELIESTVLKETGYKISLENPTLKMGLLPSVWIKADNLSIINDNKTDALKIEKPFIKIKLLPLLSKKLNIGHFSADNITANLVFDKNSKLKLGQYPIILSDKPLPIELDSAKLKINSYKINLDDKVQSKNIFLNGHYLIVDEYKANNHIDFSTLADLYVGEKASYIKADVELKLPINKVSDDQLQVSGYITNLDLANFSPYAKSLSKGKIRSLSGIINLTAKTIDTIDNHRQIQTELTLTNLGILQQDPAASMSFKDKLILKTDIKTIKNGIDINEISLNGKGLSTSLFGTINKINSKVPSLNLKMSINKSNIENILPLMPGERNLLPDIDLYLLKKSGFWGNIAGNLDITGKPDTPNINGNIMAWNGYLLKPIPNADKAVIKLGFKGQKMDMDIRVPTGPNAAVLVKGPVELYNEKKSDLMITNTGIIDLKTAQTVLNPLHKILHFDLGPVPVMDINGKGVINLHVVGNKANPHAWGEFKFNDGTVSFLDVHNMTMTQSSGLLTFDDQSTTFITKSALLNGKPITVDGTCSLLGVLDFKVNTSGQDLGNLLKIVRTSPMLVDIQKMIEPIEFANGNSDFFLNLTGTVKDVNDIIFNKNLFAKGKITLHSDTIKIKEIPTNISYASGVVNFDNMNADFNLLSRLNKSELNLQGKLKDNICDAKITSDRFHLKDALAFLPEKIKIPYKDDLAKISTSFVAKYNGKIDAIEYNKIHTKGKIYSNKGVGKDLVVGNSSFELNNSNFKLANLQGFLKNSPFEISADLSRIFERNDMLVNGLFNIQNLDLNLINDEKLKLLLPPDISKLFNDCKNFKGSVNLAARVRNNNLSAYTVLDDMSMIYQPKHLKISVKSGALMLKNDILNINKLNTQIGVMPVFINGKIANIYQKPNVNLYVNAKPTQEFFDQFFNYKALYPIKIKGDVILTSDISGTIDNLNTKSELKVNENSSIYYMGASIGDIENPVRLTIDNNLSPNKVKINSLQYDKIITSQNNKPFVNTQLNASGTINMLPNNNIGFNNLRIKTENPTDAKIFNIIFRKPTMKQGVFTSDLVLNGTAFNPKIRGKLDITSIDMPFLDTTIKDVNLDFKNDNIIINSHGTFLANDIFINALMKNNFTPPFVFEDLKLKIADLDINKINDTLRDLEVDSSRNPSISQASSQAIDLSQIIIKKAKVEADKIKIRNINADKFEADLSLNEKMLVNINKFKFNIANGSVLGNLKYNLLNRKASLNLHLDDANAQIMSEALFDLKGQIYGLASGDINLVCNGTSHETCFKTLYGEGYFSVDDGKMPKLGSLEYLLKAGNLVRGGFTGLSISSLIDLITPLKTGEFESISGDFHISNGIAKKINIYSNGKDLNMYMTGSYNFMNSIADMKIYGSLTKNITSVFGKVKNVSLNTLLNTIPGVNDSTETLILQSDISKIPGIQNASSIYRIFRADIYGDINGEDYVKSFKWVK